MITFKVERYFWTVDHPNCHTSGELRTRTHSFNLSAASHPHFSRYSWNIICSTHYPVVTAAAVNDGVIDTSISKINDNHIFDSFSGIEESIALNNEQLRTDCAKERVKEQELEELTFEWERQQQGHVHVSNAKQNWLILHKCIKNSMQNWSWNNERSSQLPDIYVNECHLVDNELYYS